MRGKMLRPPAPSTNEGCHSSKAWAVPAANERAAGAAVSGSAPQTRIPGLSALSADAGDHRGGVGRVLEDLERHRRVAGDEGVVVEGMDERALDAREAPFLHRFPGDRERHQHQGRAQRTHALELGHRGGFHRHHRAADAGLPRGVGHSLAGVAGADGPHATLTLGGPKKGECIGGAAQLVGIDGLQVLQLEPDLRKTWAQFKAHQRRAHRRAGDAFARGPDVRQVDRAYGFQVFSHGLYYRARLNY